MNTLQVWANTTMAFCQTFMGMIASLFTAVLAINVFKDTNEEGTELIIISKPISRFKIVMTKFILFGFFCILINLSTVILSAFTILLPRTEPRFYVGLLVSMFIGNAITFAVFGSISILLTVKFAKVGVIVTNVILSLVFLIYQTLTLFVFSTPAKKLDDNYMTGSSYILQKRNVETGEYVEDEIVNFSPNDLPKGKVHPCSAKNWRSMEYFWEHDIQGKSVSPVLTTTDLAGQIGLTYMVYSTNEFAWRQAQRMFAISRFYNYELTSPASPEIIGGVSDKETIDWIYTDFYDFNIDEDIHIYLPAEFGYAGIKPLSTTRLRGYADAIPVGTVKSKELLSAQEVFFEKEEWMKYKPLFDLMYDAVFAHENYSKFEPTDYSAVDYPVSFAISNESLKRYYEIVWSCFTGNDRELIKVDSPIKNYSAADFDIKSVQDLNERFIQFKNYVYWKALAEQTHLLYDAQPYEPTDMPFETDARVEAKAELESIIVPTIEEPAMDILGIRYQDNSWMMEGVEYPLHSISQLIEYNTRAPAFTWIKLSNEKEELSVNNAEKAETITHEQADDILMHSPLAILQKTAALFNNVCSPNERYLYSSLTSFERTAKYSGETYMVKDNWYPYILTKYSPIPLGQNMTYFFFDTKPVIQYWVFAVVWGAFSMLMFTGGAIVYNKYDVK
ncbi:MAG: ABC transporter permease [Mycoplasma sp.]|nr:ABC transporter permease [Candidatus Hennigella equi]